jgi:thiamine kinase-like enzyme
MSNLELGLSGCKIEKISDHVIRKTSKDINYNNRLLKQIDKQLEFSKTNKLFFTPKIINVCKDDLFYFDMEYSSGKNYSQFFDHCDIKEIKNFENVLLSYLRNNLEDGNLINKSEAEEIFINKLTQLRDNSKYKLLINNIIQNISSLNLNNIPKSFCHGDLSLSNILFDKNFVLIDFLDSFVDTPLVDIAKLKQDLYYYWCLKTQDIQSTRIKIIFSYLWYNIDKNFSKYTHSHAFELIDLINLLRIEPYVSQQNEKILRDCIESHQYYVNFNNSNGRIVQ